MNEKIVTRKDIESIADAKIRPQLAEHQGDMEIVSLTDGVVRIRLLGRCSGCPSAMLTTEELIKAEIMKAIPQVKDVIVVQETSPELIEFAKKLMTHDR